MPLATGLAMLPKGLVFDAVVTAVVPGTGGDFTCTGLTGPGYGDRFFDNWYVFIAHKADGTVPPTTSNIVAFYLCSQNGVGYFSCAPFVPALAAGDEIYLIHPSLGGILPAIAAAISGLKPELKRPSPTFFETCNFLDPLVWDWTDPLTGMGWWAVAGLGGSNMWFTSVPNANEFARLSSRDFWTVGPAVYGTNLVYRAFYLEFELMLTNLANINEATTFFGMSNSGDTRASNNIIGFALIGGALLTITKVGAAEVTNTGFGENLLVTNKLRIRASNGLVQFYLNETLIAAHTNITSTLTAAKVANFYLGAGAGGATAIRVAPRRIWYEDEV